MPANDLVGAVGVGVDGVGGGAAAFLWYCLFAVTLSISSLPLFVPPTMTLFFV